MAPELNFQRGEIQEMDNGKFRIRIRGKNDVCNVDHMRVDEGERVSVDGKEYIFEGKGKDWSSGLKYYCYAYLLPVEDNGSPRKEEKKESTNGQFTARKASHSHDQCRNCHQRRSVTERADMSGIIAPVCGQCARYSAFDISFA